MTGLGLQTQGITEVVQSSGISIGPLMPIILAVISMVLSGYITYNNNDKSIASRLSVVETNRENDVERLNRIEMKIDRLLSRPSK